MQESNPTDAATWLTPSNLQLVATGLGSLVAGFVAAWTWFRTMRRDHIADLRQDRDDKKALLSERDEEIASLKEQLDLAEAELSKAQEELEVTLDQQEEQRSRRKQAELTRKTCLNARALLTDQDLFALTVLSVRDFATEKWLCKLIRDWSQATAERLFPNGETEMRVSFQRLVDAGYVGRSKRNRTLLTPMNVGRKRVVADELERKFPRNGS